MNIEEQNIERTRQETKLSELSQHTEELKEQERNSPLSEMTQNDSDCKKATNAENVSFKAAISPGVVIYGLHKVSEIPAVREVIENCKESIGDKISDIGSKIKDFFTGMFNNVKDFFSGNDADSKAIEKMGEDFVEQRDFGLAECTEAAKEIFNLGVVENWANLSLEQRKEIAGTYAFSVAEAFDLKNYRGVVFEDLEPGTRGQTCGDGIVHISNELMTAWSSPLDIMNTVTHELRHQYQMEAISGLHNVSEDVINEWSTAYELYNYNQPYCYDPWGYRYNPVEIDARYAGETVVRNYTHDIINA